MDSSGNAFGRPRTGDEGPTAARGAGRGARRTLPARENDLLAEVCRAIVQGRTPGDVVQDCAERLQRYFRTASVGIWFQRDDRLVLEGVCLPDRHGSEVLETIRARWDDVPVEADLPVPRCMRSRTILRWAAGDPELAPPVRQVLHAIEAEWVVAIPIFVDAEPVGGAVVVLPERDDLTAADELLLEQALGVVGVVYTRAALQERELRHRDRALGTQHMTAVGELAAGVAHQVNNPLNSILHLATLVLEEEPDEPVRGWTLSLLREARRAARAMDTLRIFARPGTGATSAVAPAAALDEAVSIMRVQLEQEDVTVHRSFEDEVPSVVADPDRLRHVFHNVLVNAREALAEDGGGEIRLDVRASGGMVEIGIEDTGPGMTSAVRDSIFQPFFTTRSEPSGDGMGLALAYRMVSEWGGEIIAGNWGHPRAEGGAPGEGGARVTIRLPAAGSDAAADGAAAREDVSDQRSSPPSGLSVLIVEDEEAVGAALVAYLERHDARVDLVERAEDAVERLESDTSYDVVISDLRMPGMGGEGLVRAVRERFPEVLDRLVLTSGDVVSTNTARWMEDSGLPFLAKPYQLQDLAAILHRLVSPR